MKSFPKLALALTGGLAATVLGSTAVLAAAPASASAGDGTVTVRVVHEVNGNGLVDDTVREPPLVGVAVHLGDAAGTTVTALTDASGLAVFDPAASALVGGEYRVTVDNPRPASFFPAPVANGQSPAAQPVTLADLRSAGNVKLSSPTAFVDVSGGADAHVNVGFWYPPYYCQDNAPLCTASQPWSGTPGAVSPGTEKTLVSVPYRFTAQEATLATVADTGTVYGIAYDRDRQRVFSAAYAKRGAAYGPGGAGAIYVTGLSSTAYPLAGATTLFATVPDAGGDNHAMGIHQDYDFWDRVGKESLGGIDVTHDGAFLFGVNMFDKTVFVYRLSDGALVGSYPIPNPGCGSDWRPMGTGVGLDTSYVGGVCSGQTDQDMNQLRAYVYPFDPATGTFGAAVVNEPLGYGRGHAYNGAYCTGAVEGGSVGRWFSWVDRYPAGPNE